MIVHHIAVDLNPTDSGAGGDAHFEPVVIGVALAVEVVVRVLVLPICRISRNLISCQIICLECF